MKLSNRLDAINSLINQSYDVIWDCCCDHGLLGMAVLKRGIAKKVVFVDIVPSLMSELNMTLTRFADSQSCSDWQVMCKDVGSITLEKNAKQLVIIAGVGGKLLLKLIQQIVANHTKQELAKISFIVCPVHHTYSLREGLSELNLGLISEQIIVENKRFYEVLQLSFACKKLITNTGSAMWDFTDINHGLYLKKLLAHYRRMTHQNTEYYDKVVKDYKQLMSNKIAIN